MIPRIFFTACKHRNGEISVEKRRNRMLWQDKLFSHVKAQMGCYYFPKHINEKWNIVRHISTLRIMLFSHKSFMDFPGCRIWEFIIPLMQMKQRKDYFWFCSCSFLIPHPEYLIAFLIDLHPDNLSPQSVSILRAKKKNKHLSANCLSFCEVWHEG